jgi:hypothetical protein
MNLIELFTAANGQLSGGDEYLWNSFGPNARYVEFKEGTITCIVDSKTMQCYAVEIFDQDNNQAWQWIEPQYRSSYLAECNQRGVDPFIAGDNIKFYSITYQDVLIKVNSLTVDNKD